MSCARALAVAAAVAMSVPAAGYAPAPLPKKRAITSALIGQWTVKFANGVVESCQVRKDGTAFVSEPLRTSAGKAETTGGAVVIRFDDDRVERWTARDDRVVVEHWFPASAYPSGGRVVGVAQRSR